MWYENGSTAVGSFGSVTMFYGILSHLLHVMDISRYIVYQSILAVAQESQLCIRDLVFIADPAVIPFLFDNVSVKCLEIIYHMNWKTEKLLQESLLQINEANTLYIYVLNWSLQFTAVIYTLSTFWGRLGRTFFLYHHLNSPSVFVSKWSEHFVFISPLHRMLLLSVLSTF